MGQPANLYYCTECKKVYQKPSGVDKRVTYHENFPTISLERKLCPKCAVAFSDVGDVTAHGNNEW